jgi:histidyl-tRNA synthetase
MIGRRWAENAMRKAISLFGYREISTPTFENTELFVAKSGPQVLEQVYEFMDKGGRSLSLRPELTAPVMRFYNSDLRSLPKPLRISYFGNCFRYERPQKGRYREFWQMGLEYIGKRTPIAVAEVIKAAITALEAVGLENFIVRIGQVTILGSILEKFCSDPEIYRDLMISIDKKDTDRIRSILEKNPEEDVEQIIGLVTSTYGPDNWEAAIESIKKTYGNVRVEAEELQTVLTLLKDESAIIRLDPSISRGLDYYDGVVFEIDSPNLGAEKQICGGGAYSLSLVFENEVEGIGFGLGFDRILVALGDGKNTESPALKTYLIPLGDLAEKRALSISAVIRQAGIPCIMETSGRGFKKAINSALSSGCTHLLVLGEN